MIRRFHIYFAVLLSFTFGCNKVEDKPKHIDHLVFTAPSLEEGMDAIEAVLGMRPVMGGRHPNYGTHNALLSLGETTYLEVIAPDPELESPQRGRLLELNYKANPRLTTWVLRSESIEELYHKATENGITLGEVESGKREKLDGTVLSWKLSDPYAFPHSGAIPFLISWGNTPHPAKVVPQAGELISLEIEHPNSEVVRQQLNVLDVHISVKQADTYKLSAKIKTETGVITLE